MQIQHIPIAAASSGVNAIKAAVTGKVYRVLALCLSASGSVNAKWQSASTDKTGLYYLVANNLVTLPYNQEGWLETVAGEALNLNLSGAVAVGGHVTIEII